MQSTKLACTFLFGTTLMASSICSAYADPARSGTISGVISDSMCNDNHAAMLKSGKYGKTAAACAAACIKAGNKPVLVSGGKVYKLSGTNVSKFAGKTVTIAGHIDQDAGMIHVHSIKAK